MANLVTLQWVQSVSFEQLPFPRVWTLTCANSRCVENVVVTLGLFLRATGTLLGIGVLPAVVFGQSLAGGANLLAPSR